MKIQLVWLGVGPPQEDMERAEKIIEQYVPGSLIPGSAIALPRYGDDPTVPKENWFVNRVQYSEAHALVILEKGAPLSPISKSEIQDAVEALVELASTQNWTAEQQVKQLTEFTCKLMKGKVYAAA